MKQAVTLFMIGWLTNWVVACVYTLSPTDSVPTATVRTTSRDATKPKVQNKAKGLRDTFEVGDARFSARSITVESSESAACAAADFDGDGKVDLESQVVNRCGIRSGLLR
jgi:hypothetical protein